MGRQPGNGVSSHILVFESLLEPFKEVIPGSKSHSCVRDSILSKGVSPSQDGPLSHVGEGKCNLLCIGVIGFFVYCKVELDGVHPGDCCFIGAIEGFGFSKLELSWFSR